MQLSAKTRKLETKGSIKAIRRAGNIPAVLYASGQTPAIVEVDGIQFASALRNIKQGRLGTTVFELEVDGKKKQAVVKDIQYDITSYRVLHLDFQLLEKNTPLKVSVPIECVGVAECAGIKLGGFLRQVIRKVKVECLPADIPEEFFVDVRELPIKGTKRLSDIAMPEKVRPLGAMNEVVALIAKR